MTLEKEEIKSLIENYIRKSCIAIENTDFLIKNEKFSLAINQCYYGIFYMLSALAFQNGFKTSKHEQLIGWFNKTYVKNDVVNKKFGKLIIKSYENRKKGDYDVFSEFSKEKAEQAFEEMKEVISEIRKLIDD
jgi:uncharacterized protein (UPF0332 family)